VEEVAGGARPIEAVGTRTAAFLGEAPDPKAHVNEAVAINNWSEFVRKFTREDSPSTSLSNAVYGFFLNGGSRCYVVNAGKDGSIAGGGRDRTGVDTLEGIDDVNMVAAPGRTGAADYESVMAHCEKMGDRVAILDPSPDATVESLTEIASVDPDGGSTEGRPRASSYAAFYYPRITVRDPLSGEVKAVDPSGHMAGVWARTDATRGVHKAPGNENVRGALGLTELLPRSAVEVLNPLGVNTILSTAVAGIRVMGARTLSSDPEWRYLNVRRLANQMKESIQQGTQWVLFEPNDYALWQAIRRDVGAFLSTYWRAGALFGRTPEEAFFVKCDEETNPPEERDLGRLTTIVGFAPAKPAEFVIFRITQWQSPAAEASEGGA
jgi:phage tail sheath protein FI